MREIGEGEGEWEREKLQQRNRQRDRQTDRDRDRQTETETDRERYRQRETGRQRVKYFPIISFHKERFHTGLNSLQINFRIKIQFFVFIEQRKIS